jgi:DNA-binding transcriptional ArsR family regulator
MDGASLRAQHRRGNRFARERMIRFRLDTDDLARSRFAISPLMELQMSLTALREPESYAIHAPWIARARPRIADLDLTLLETVVPARGWVPDFAGPPPLEPSPDPEAEIERVRRSDPELVRRELSWVWPQGPPAALRPLVEDTERGLEALAQSMRDYWERAMAPDWPAIRATLTADIRRRATHLAAGGIRAALAALHPDVSLAADERTIELASRVEADVPLDGRGLLLIPSAFWWPGSSAVIDAHWQPCLIYAPDGVAALWEPGGAEPEQALQALLGRGRARVLGGLDTPVGTLELARRLGLSPAGVSAHLRVLAGAGLAVTTREGRSVLYSRTPLGDALWSG